MHTRLMFTSAQVRDLDVSQEFFTQVIGFEAAEQSPPGAVVFRNDHGSVFAIRLPLPGTDLTKDLGLGMGLWFSVADVDALHARIVSAGGQVVSPPQAGPFGRMVVVSAPDGYQLTFYQEGETL
ncbi:VOC family protein (plasmid) [Deinococcus sp. KNUC1210]|uniref:VOC family protein n=1 Tax=Deinococcus sp. KNUC1210 TaxID=2917691 RepID=UPI001EF1385B|nr:VOC family protein [Deinococcus sp. KNUC1210]ULH17630.1 VOC family protein [Deinococcus sp. KNUC1210]